MLLPALLALALLSALVVRLMIGRGVLDMPGARSSHDVPTPKGGGIGIACAFLAGVGLAWATGHAGADPWRPAALLAAVILITAVSWADDVGQFQFHAKLAAQIAASILLIAAGFTIGHVGPLALPDVIAIPFTLGWMLFAINAVNFIDGLNGLASGSILVVAVCAGLVTPDPAMRAASLALAAGIAGFLPYNYPKARIFMGDAGSQACGLVAAASASTLATQGGWGAALVPMGLAGILGDVAFTLIRRWRAGERLTEAHRGHLYQLAHRSGVEAALIAAIYWGFALWGSALGVMSLDADPGGLAAAIALAAAPVIVWGAGVIQRARRSSLGRW